MAKDRIAGITVEIGGETAPLSKALSSVNKELSSTQRSLKDVERLLTLDPGNVTLLAQKYQYLSQQTEGTRQKLDALKNAEKEVQAQFAAGKISQAQYDALQREIAATEISLSKVTKEAEETEDAINGLGDESEDAAKDVDELGNESKETASHAEKLKEKFQAAGVAIGGAFSSAVSKTAEMMANLAKTIAVTMAAATAAVVKFSVDFAQTAAEVKAETSQFEQTFGDMQGAASEAINRVADSSGILSTRLNSTATSIYAFAKASGAEVPEAMDLMERGLGVAADSAAYYDKSLEETSETLKSFLKGNYANDAALGVSATEFTRNAAATRLYGKEFNDLTEVQKQFTLLNMVEEANKLSGALGQAARESDGLENVLGNMKEAWRQTKASLGEPILEAAVPIMQNLVALIPKITQNLLPLTNGIANLMTIVGSGDLQGVVNFLRGDEILSGLESMASGMTTLLNHLLSIAPQFLGVATLYIETFASGLVTALSTIPKENIASAIVSVFMLAATYIFGFLEVGTVIVTKLAEGIAAAAPSIVATASALILQFLNGVQAALPTLLTAAGQIVAALLQGIIDNGEQIMFAAQTIIYDIWKGIGDQLPTLIPLALEAILVLVSGLLSAESIGNLMDAALSLIKGLAQGLINSIPTLVERAPALIGGLVQGLLENLPKIRETGFEIVSSLITTLLENLPEIIAMGFKIVGELAGAFIKAIPEIVSSIGSIASTITDTIGSIDLVEIGKNIIQGLINGISSMIGKVGETISNIGNKIRDTITGTGDGGMDINSPSGVMENDVGHWIPAGLAKGIESNMGVVQVAAEDMAATVTMNATGGTGSATATTNGTNTNNSVTIEKIEIITPDGSPQTLSENLLDTLEELMSREKAVFA